MNLATHSIGRAAIADFISRCAIDIVHIEHFHYAKYAFHISSKLKKTIVYHDLYHTLYSQKAVFENNRIKKLLLWLDCWKFYLFERRLDQVVDFKIFLNSEEMRLLPRKAVHIPHVANPAIQFKMPRQIDRINILFIGAYKHPPNVMSVELIIERILPVLAEKTDQFKIHLIGSGTENFRALVDRSPQKRFIVIRGFVADINEALKDMDVALFPICYGGGVKTKILDAMSAGVPIVTTPEGLIGLANINGDCIAHGKTPADLVAQLTRLMNDDQLRRSMAQAARTYVDGQNSYRIFAGRIDAVYACL
jgi:glycosyltransferase involved in cell wall biosynthesis